MLTVLVHPPARQEAASCRAESPLHPVTSHLSPSLSRCLSSFAFLHRVPRSSALHPSVHACGFQIAFSRSGHSLVYRILRRRDCRHRVNHSARKNSSGDRVDCYICRCTWTCPIPRLRLVSRVNGPAKRRLTRARVESARATLIECPAKARSLLDNNSPRIKR